MAITLTIQRAAQESGLSRRTLQYAIAQGRLKSVRVGRRRLIPEKALERFLLAGSGSDSGQAVGGGAVAVPKPRRLRGPQRIN